MFDQAGFLAQFRDVIIVTAAYFGLYYAFVVNTVWFLRDSIHFAV